METIRLIMFVWRQQTRLSEASDSIALLKRVIAGNFGFAAEQEIRMMAELSASFVPIYTHNVGLLPKTEPI